MNFLDATRGIMVVSSRNQFWETFQNKYANCRYTHTIYTYAPQDRCNNVKPSYAEPLWDGTAITYFFNVGMYINSNWLLRYAAGDLGTMAMCAVQPPSKQIMEEQKEARWKGTAENMLDMGGFWRQPRKVPSRSRIFGPPKSVVPDIVNISEIHSGPSWFLRRFCSVLS